MSEPLLNTTDPTLRGTPSPRVGVPKVVFAIMLLLCAWGVYNLRGCVPTTKHPSAAYEKIREAEAGFATVSPSPRTAKAAITSLDGSKLPDTIEPGSTLVLSSAKSVADSNQGARLWEVDPPTAKVIVAGDNVVLAAGNYGPVTVRLYVAAGNVIGRDHVTFAVAGGRVPLPEPSGETDPDVREAAAAYFGDYAAEYAGANGKDYNAFLDDALKARKANGVALGKAIDAVIQPLVDPKTGAWVDKDKAAKAQAVVGRSLAAGMRDALTTTSNARK